MLKMAALLAFVLTTVASAQDYMQPIVPRRHQALPVCRAALPTGTACVWPGGSGYLYSQTTGQPTHVYAVLVDPVGLPDFGSTTEKIQTFGWTLNVHFGETCDSGYWAFGNGVIDHCPLDTNTP